MWGFVAFILAAACIAGFAYTASSAYRSVDTVVKEAFTTAFYLLALDMVLWGFSALGDDGSVKKSLIIASDSLLLVASGFMVRVLIRDWADWMAVPLSFLGAGVLAQRIYDFPPQAYVRDGLLYLNLQPTVRTAVLGVLFAVWLPAVMKVALQAGRDGVVPMLENKLIAIFTILLLATGFFLSTQQETGIVLSFIAILVLFALAAVTNILVIRLYGIGGTAHATKRSTK